MNTIVFHIWSEFFAMGKDIKNRSAFNGTDVFAVSEMVKETSSLTNQASPRHETPDVHSADCARFRHPCNLRESWKFVGAAVLT
ncbi:hypothetical protein C4D60_Mb02t10050 [Musa balbisiana]|uniref:Uncharacterized protein n=1 Tax=Musa balbisiana TaxID=52838 RepID=A0A4S8IAZ3_MUSBA|nr:hypothetical protein C4D60_Mb02t10050 [Musa balbisiana]